MELREKIAAELSRGWVAIPSEPGRIADRILSIPEIAEALNRPVGVAVKQNGALDI